VKANLMTSGNKEKRKRKEEKEGKPSNLKIHLHLSQPFTIFLIGFFSFFTLSQFSSTFLDLPPRD